jgi:hypothetical protein
VNDAGEHVACSASSLVLDRAEGTREALLHRISHAVQPKLLRCQRYTVVHRDPATIVCRAFVHSPVSSLALNRKPVVCPNAIEKQRRLARTIGEMLKQREPQPPIHAPDYTSLQ